MNIDHTKVLTCLEDTIIHYCCSDDFELKMASVHSMQGVMRVFEYQLMAYFDLYHRVVENNPLNGDQSKYEVQSDFIKVVQQKICWILSRHNSSYLAEKGFVMNSISTKALVEFLHAYLNFISRFSARL
jgi:hypothetical protein